jgi:hypothetical protein
MRPAPGVGSGVILRWIERRDGAISSVDRGHNLIEQIIDRYGALLAGIAVNGVHFRQSTRW